MSLIQHMKLDWSPFTTTDAWCDRWTLKTNRLSVLHEDLRAQIMTTLMCWRFGGSSFPAEILMIILIKLSQPPFILRKRCYCCNALIAVDTCKRGINQCKGCVYFCSPDCKRKADTCSQRMTKRLKKSPLEPLPNRPMFCVPPFYNDNYAEMIQMRHPKEYDFIRALNETRQSE